jgi:hypothetical protein
MCVPPAGSVIGQSASLLRENARRIFHDHLKAISAPGILGIFRTHRESGDQKRLCANENQETHPMTKRLLLGMSAILSAAIAAPLCAQTVVQEPHAYALNLPNVGTAIGSAPPRRQDVSIVNHGIADAMRSAPSVRPWTAGNETVTKPWSAPAGHHQPTAADVLESDSRLTLDQENANVDRIVRGVCRGC